MTQFFVVFLIVLACLFATAVFLVLIVPFFVHFGEWWADKVEDILDAWGRRRDKK